jgi:hypothetical protein
MKHGKKPAVAQKELMQSKGMTREQSEQYFVIKNTSKEMIVVHRLGGDPIKIDKSNGLRK